MLSSMMLTSVAEQTLLELARSRRCRIAIRCWGASLSRLLLLEPRAALSNFEEVHGYSMAFDAALMRDIGCRSGDSVATLPFLQKWHLAYGGVRFDDCMTDLKNIASEFMNSVDLNSKSSHIPTLPAYQYSPPPNYSNSAHNPSQYSAKVPQE